MQFTRLELEEALRALASTIGKCEKVKPKLPRGSSQHTLLVRRIAALRIATTLIERELIRVAPETPVAVAASTRKAAPVSKRPRSR